MPAAVCPRNVPEIIATVYDGKAQGSDESEDLP